MKPFVINPQSGSQQTDVGVGLSLKKRFRRCPYCKIKLKRGIAIENTYTGIPDFIGDKYPITVSAGGSGKIIKCLKCPKCGYSIYDN